MPRWFSLSLFSFLTCITTSGILLLTTRHPHGWGFTTAVFEEVITVVRPRIIIEISTFLGVSALHMAALTRRHSLNASVILCLDDFRGWLGFWGQPRLARHLPVAKQGDEWMLWQFILAVATTGEEKRVVPLPFMMTAGLAALCEWGVYANLVEMDAGHDFHSTWADINMAFEVLRRGGLMFGHDYHTKVENMGVKRAVKQFVMVKRLKVRSHGEHWVLEPKPQSIADNH